MKFIGHPVVPRPSRSLPAVPGSAAAFLLVALGDPRLVLTGNDAETRRWARELSLYCALAGRPAPAAVLSPDEASPGDRVEALRRVLGGEAEFVVASLDVALARIPDVRGFEAATVVLNQGEDIEPALLAELLGDMGYRPVSIVASPGEFAPRGGILDVFSTGGGDLPLRVEFFGDRIDSMRLFEVESQRSIRTAEQVAIPPALEREGTKTLLEILPSHGRVVSVEEDTLAGRIAGDEDLLRIQTVTTGEAASFLAQLGGLGITAEERRAADEPIEDAMARLRDMAETSEILVVCSTLGEAERARDIMRDADIVAPIIAPERVRAYEGRIAVTLGDLSGGFRLADPPAIVVTSGELFGARYIRRRPSRPSRVAGLLSSLDELSEGDLVVHEDQGVGRYLGLRRLDGGDEGDDVLVVEYAGGDLFYLPIRSIAKLRAYHGAGTASPRLDTLGGRSWKKTRSRVKKKVRDMAEELIRLYATRSRVQGYAFPGDSPLYHEFVDAFPYEETPDQLKAEEEIFRAMETPAVMDRLLCGDVGYGKTEVAMRAAFKAVADGKQVAMLVPTTILAEQHFETFSNRFKPFPVRVDFLSRFKTPARQKATVAGVAAGETDILIGTHRLLAKDVKIPNLGLLIVDEEHKFGVTHKERLQQITTNVDVLTLSATPIPRTLHMALSGIRGISTIETPPEERMAVKTIVARYGDGIVREALDREFRRGGQAYFVHNRVETIYKVGAKLQAMFPEKNVAVAHGQMKERQLEKVMHDFFHGDSDLLVCTSIIGSGLDVPRSNTIVVDRADRFGLADLYQLRGRVGRSDVRAYAYFLIPGDEDLLTGEAKQRLSALRELSYLGAGFRLAMKDLEIRGAGNLLGAEQSGHIDAVGFDLYTEMLGEAIAELQGLPTATRIDPVIDLPADARIPESYLEDGSIRFTFYRRLGNVEDRQALDDLGKELADRFGPCPPELERLLELVGLKIMCRDAGIMALRWRKGEIRVEIAPEGGVDPDRLVNLSQERPGLFRFLPDGGLCLVPKNRDWSSIFETARDFLEILGNSPPRG